MTVRITRGGSVEFFETHIAMSNFSIDLGGLPNVPDPQKTYAKEIAEAVAKYIAGRFAIEIEIIERHEVAKTLAARPSLTPADLTRKT